MKKKHLYQDAKSVLLSFSVGQNLEQTCFSPQKLDINLTDLSNHHLLKGLANKNLPHFAIIAQDRQQFIEEKQILVPEIPDHQSPSLNKLGEVSFNGYAEFLT